MPRLLFTSGFAGVNLPEFLFRPANVAICTHLVTFALTDFFE